MPIALCVGKRPVILLTLLIFTTGSIWSFKATSFNSLLGARVFASIGLTQLSHYYLPTLILSQVLVL